MSLFNDNLKNIKIISLTVFIIVSYLVLYILGNVSGLINEKWLYVVIIVYFIIKLRNCFDGFKEDFHNVFSKIELRYVLLIVFCNIFFSYGMLYLANALIPYFPALELFRFYIPSMSLAGSLPIFGMFVSTVIISPISEELIFRGVVLNRLKLVVPTIFAVLVSSLLFAALHSYGSIISAFVFAVCMAILYLKTENICVPILAHFLNNLFAEIIRFADYNELLFTNDIVMAVVSVLAIASAIILLDSITKELNKVK
jgi:hypothetical protein